jgi:HEAT repeat protein
MIRYVLPWLILALPVTMCLQGCITEVGDTHSHSHEDEADDDAGEVAQEEGDSHGHEHGEADGHGPEQMPFEEPAATKPLDVKEARRLLEAEDAQQRAQVARRLALCLSGPDREEFKAMLVEAARDDADANVRAAAVASLAALGDEVFELMLSASRDEDAEVRLQAAGNLAQTVEHVETALVRLEAMRADEDLDVRERAAEAADRLKGTGRLIAALGDPELDRSARASYTLAVDPTAVEPLMHAIRTSQNPRQRHAAVSTLWAICSGQTRGQKDYAEWARSFYWHGAPERPQANPVAVPLLMDVLANDPDPFVRESAAQGLGHCGDTRAVPVLIEALKDAHTAVRRRAASALVVLPDQRATGALAKLAAGDECPAVRRYATEALGWIGGADEQAIEALISKLQDPDPDVREIAADHLGRGRNRTPKAMQPLIALFEDPHEDVRWEAVKAVGSYSDKSDTTTAALVARLTDPAPHVRNAAEEALRQVGYKRLAPGMEGAEPVRDAGEELQFPG